MSDNAIATLCGVCNHMIAAARPVTLDNIQPEKRTGSDGKSYPATRKPSIFAPDAPEADPLHDSGEEDTDAPDVP